MVDLGEKTKISGLIIVTWQGQGQGKVYKGICATYCELSNPSRLPVHTGYH